MGGFQGNEQIDDWEVWGDPKEIERRKAERKRAAMHPEARKEQVALFPAHLVYSSHRDPVYSGHVLQALLSEFFFISEGQFSSEAYLQVAEEWATARGEAARAKAAGDKSRQKAAGQVIAGLKKEIAQLGEPHDPSQDVTGTVHLSNPAIFLGKHKTARCWPSWASKAIIPGVWVTQSAEKSCQNCTLP